MKHASRLLLGAALAAISLFSLPACSSTGGLSPILVEAGSSIITAEAIFRGVPAAQRPAVAAKIYTFASAARSMATGEAPDPALFTSTLNAWSGGDPALLLVATNLVNAYRAYYPQIKARNPDAIALFEGIARGVETAAALYLPPPPVVAQRP